MRVVFEHAATAGSGGEFEVEMSVIPREGEDFNIENIMIPSYYFEGFFVNHPLESLEEGMVTFTIFTVAYMITKKEQYVRICLDSNE